MVQERYAYSQRPLYYLTVSSEKTVPGGTAIAVAPDLVGSGHTLTLYGVTSVTKSDFVLDPGPVLAP